MDNPFGPPKRNKNQSPTPPNSFQRELELKMKQRKKAGLTADITPSESGQESEELDSDDELLSGFNMTGKSKSPGRKSPLHELNGVKGKKPTKTELIFGKKSNTLYEDDDEDDDDLENASGDLMRTMRQPFNFSTTSKTGKKQPQARQRSPHSIHEDEVDADMSNMSRYMKGGGGGGTGHKDKWSPPQFQKSSLLEDDERDEQLKLDLQKTKLRPKSPKPGRKTPSDLDSITEEREMDDLDVTTPKSGRSTTKPVPKPRDNKSGFKKEDQKPRGKSLTDPKAKPRMTSPSTDIFGATPKQRTKSPYDDMEKEYKSSFSSKDKGKTDKDKKDRKSPVLLDMLAGSSSKTKPGDKKSPKGKQGEKNKYLTHDDSDDSIGGEIGRKDDVSRKKSYEKGSPLDRFSPDKNRGSPFEKGRTSPFDPRSRTNPYDARRSPFDDERSDRMRTSPLSVHEDRKLRDSNPYADRTFQDSLIEQRKIKEQERNKPQYSKTQNKKDTSSKGYSDMKSPKKDDNPFAKSKKDSRDHSDERYDSRDDRYDQRDHYGDKGDKDRYGDPRRSPYDRDGDRNPYKDRSPQRDARDDRYKDHFEDPLGRKSPFSTQRRDYEDDRRSPFGKKGHDDTDNRGFGKDRHVGFERSERDRDRSWDRSRDMDKPPSLRSDRDRDKSWDKHKDQYGRDRRSPFERDSLENFDRKPRLRRDEDDEYDKYSRKQEHKDAVRKAHERESRSTKRGKKTEERESSICRDVEEDPSPMKKASTEEEEKLKKRKIKPRTVENSLLEQAIESVKEEQTRFKPVNPDKSKDNKDSEKKRSQSARHRPKPRYAKPMVESFPTARPGSANVDLDNTTSIREAVFLEWYKERNEKAKKEKEEKLKKEKEEAEKKRKEEEDKKLESIASYNAWAEKKKDYLQDKQKQKRREEMKKAKEEEEKQEKKDQAAKSFRLWKESKDVIIVDKERQKKMEEQRKLRDEEHEKKQKQKDAKSAFNRWNEKKGEVISEKEKEKRREMAKTQREERRKQAHREKEAGRSYEDWMKKKAKSQREERKTMKMKNVQEFDEPKPAWSPASRTIPFGH